MKYNRLVHFQKNGSSLSKYRAAIGVLYSLGIDQILNDLSRPSDVPINAENPLEVNALQNQRNLGFRECIDALFTLDTANVPDDKRLAPDYGAIEKMISEGRIKPEDIESLTEDIM